MCFGEYFLNVSVRVEKRKFFKITIPSLHLITRNPNVYQWMLFQHQCRKYSSKSCFLSALLLIFVLHQAVENYYPMRGIRNVGSVWCRGHDFLQSSQTKSITCLMGDRSCFKACPIPFTPQPATVTAMARRPCSATAGRASAPASWAWTATSATGARAEPPVSCRTACRAASVSTTGTTSFRT